MTRVFPFPSFAPAGSLVLIIHAVHGEMVTFGGGGGGEGKKRSTEKSKERICCCLFPPVCSPQCVYKLINN